MFSSYSFHSVTTWQSGRRKFQGTKKTLFPFVPRGCSTRVRPVVIVHLPEEHLIKFNQKWADLLSQPTSVHVLSLRRLFSWHTEKTRWKEDNTDSLTFYNRHGQIEIVLPYFLPPLDPFSSLATEHKRPRKTFPFTFARVQMHGTGRDESQGALSRNTALKLTSIMTSKKN